MLVEEKGRVPNGIRPWAVVPVPGQKDREIVQRRVVVLTEAPQGACKSVAEMPAKPPCLSQGSRGRCGGGRRLGHKTAPATAARAEGGHPNGGMCSRVGSCQGKAITRSSVCPSICVSHFVEQQPIGSCVTVAWMTWPITLLSLLL